MTKLGCGTITLWVKGSVQSLIHGGRQVHEHIYVYFVYQHYYYSNETALLWMLKIRSPLLIRTLSVITTSYSIEA